MYYILYKLNNFKVMHIDTEPLKKQDWSVYGKAEFNSDLPKGDWLTVANIHEEIETWKEKQTQYKTITELEPQEQWKVVYEEKEDFDEEGNPITYKAPKRVKQIVKVEVEKEVEEEVEIEKSKTHIVCDLVAHFYPKTDKNNLTEKQKENLYNNLTTRYIREKYNADAVEALLANYAEDPIKYQQEFSAFAQYRKDCKARAYKEVYGI